MDEKQEAHRKHGLERNPLDVIKAGLIGVVVGDALGVPVEFTSRVARRADPVTDMREYGKHNQPKGTWSDDSSMMLATLDSIVNNGEIRYADIMENFRMWLQHGSYTPHGNVFGVGITCLKAISKSRSALIAPNMCGGTGEKDNGNGSLMRIMPISLYDALDENYWHDVVLERVAENIHGVSSLTHRHPRSLMGCMIYTSVCHELIFRADEPIYMAVWKGVHGTLNFYEQRAEQEQLPWYDEAFKAEVGADKYGRLRDLEAFMSLPDSEIQSSGYVVHTLEAAIWCLLHSDSYKDCVLHAVNLGGDADTVGAVAGGLAGLAYGYDNIPKDWVEVIVKKDWIIKRCEDFAHMYSVYG